MVLALGACVLGSGMQGSPADATGHPYAAIAERNLFNLRPPPPATPPEPPPPPVPKITLTGITTILGNKRALFKVQPQGKPPAPGAKDEFYILAEGQRDGDVEVLAIDDEAGIVKLNNHGTVQELSLDKDGVKPPLTPFTPPAAASTAGPGQGQATSGQPLPSIPPRTLRLPPAAPKAPVPPNSPSAPSSSP
jgi:hypothetical protein